MTTGKGQSGTEPAVQEPVPPIRSASVAERGRCCLVGTFNTVYVYSSSGKTIPKRVSINNVSMERGNTIPIISNVSMDLSLHKIQKHQCRNVYERVI
jgi:hypothetical protein